MPKKYVYHQNSARIYANGRTTRTLTPVERLTPEEKSEIEEAFGLFDVDGSGYIDFKELLFALKCLGIHRTKSSVDRLLKQILKRPQIGLTRKNFVELVATINLGGTVDRDEIREAYRLIGNSTDDEGNSKISLRQLRSVVEELGESISDRKLQLMINEAEIDAQADIDDEELLKVIKRTSLFYDPIKDR